MCLAHMLKKILKILSFGGHLGRHLEYFHFPNDAKGGIFQFRCTKILENTFMQKHFVRTIFWGCTKNLHLATRLIPKNTMSHLLSTFTLKTQCMHQFDTYLVKIDLVVHEILSVSYFSLFLKTADGGQFGWSFCEKLNCFMKG